jgi:hypothetical protein
MFGAVPMGKDWEFRVEGMHPLQYSENQFFLRIRGNPLDMELTPFSRFQPR